MEQPYSHPTTVVERDDWLCIWTPNGFTIGQSKSAGNFKNSPAKVVFAYKTFRGADYKMEQLGSGFKPVGNANFRTISRDKHPSLSNETLRVRVAEVLSSLESGEFITSSEVMRRVPCGESYRKKVNRAISDLRPASTHLNATYIGYSLVA